METNVGTVAVALQCTEEARKVLQAAMEGGGPWRSESEGGTPGSERGRDEGSRREDPLARWAMGALAADVVAGQAGKDGLPGGIPW